VFVEELHAAGARFCVCDPTDAWYGLKSSRDGKSPGIPCVVMGGEHGDVPLASESGEIIADFAADPTSPSCVLELKQFTQGEIVRFMTAFLARLYHKNTHPLHLVLDEADQFAPQRPMPGEQAMLGAAQRVTKMGRNKGLHPILITQRPATLSKNVLTQAGMLISHAITGPQDRKAIDDWIRANAEEGERETFLAELSGMPKGTAYFWSPDIPIFRKVAVRDRKTFDSSATPGQTKRVEPKALADVDLDGLKKRIAATIEKAKADDPRELRKQIAELQRELAAAKKRPELITQHVEVPVLSNDDRAVIERLHREATTLTASADRMWEEVGLLVRRAEQYLENGGALVKVRSAQRRSNPPKPVPVPVSSPQMRSKNQKSNGSLPLGERRVLTAIAQHRDGVTREQLTVLTGYKRSSRDTYLQRLKERGLILIDGAEIIASDRGVQALGSDFEPLPTGDALRAHWMEKLPEGERRILSVLVESYPGSVSRDDLSEATGYKRSSRDTYLQRLSARRLVHSGFEGVIASEELFS